MHRALFMTDNCSKEKNALLEQYDESETILRTPENLSTHSVTYNVCDVGNDNCDDIIESSSNISSIIEPNNSVEQSSKSSEIALVLEEWQIFDAKSGRYRPPRQNEFLRLLLKNSRYSSYVCWLDESKGSFQILEPNKVAQLWGKVKARRTQGEMNYETFARGVRYYYGTGAMTKTHKKYTFCFKQSMQ